MQKSGGGGPQNYKRMFRLRAKLGGDETKNGLSSKVRGDTLKCTAWLDKYLHLCSAKTLFTNRREEQGKRLDEKNKKNQIKRGVVYNRTGNYSRETAGGELSPTQRAIPRWGGIATGTKLKNKRPADMYWERPTTSCYLLCKWDCGNSDNQKGHNPEIRVGKQERTYSLRMEGGDPQEKVDGNNTKATGAPQHQSSAVHPPFTKRPRKGPQQMGQSHLKKGKHIVAGEGRNQERVFSSPKNGREGWGDLNMIRL